MRRAALLLLIAACGADDDRPARLSYILPAILEPSCATSRCHAGDDAPRGLRFDEMDPAALRDTLLDHSLIYAGQPGGSPLLNWLRGGDDVPTRMPPDQPLPAADIALIERWIAEGAPL